ncbi:MAG: OmpA family protein [Crocinitomicaceae bacterium]|nr:OmpA family protein [Crocinitomicaceae bacterium]MDG1657048.1 OmpA family protein [Crocinitomicaceae bacterium]
MNKSISYHFEQRFLGILCLLLLFLVSTTSVHAQASDTTVLYKHDLKYVGSSTTIDPNYRYVMEELIEILNTNPATTIHIRGHVCCGPSDRISFTRARRVFKYFVKHGIDRQRISFKGYSDEVPLVFPEKTEEDEFMNRRVDFIINYHS